MVDSTVVILLCCYKWFDSVEEVLRGQMMTFARPLAKKPLARIVLIDTFFGTCSNATFCCHPVHEFFLGKIVRWDNTCL